MISPVKEAPWPYGEGSHDHDQMQDIVTLEWAPAKWQAKALDHL
jgi:hypothetical protein